MKFKLSIAFLFCAVVAAVAQKSEHINPHTLSFTSQYLAVYIDVEEETTDTLYRYCFETEYNITPDSIACLKKDGEGLNKVIISNTLKKELYTAETSKKGDTLVYMESLRDIKETNKNRKILPATLRGTSDTATIDGYRCRRYSFEDANTQGYIWFTQEIEVQFVEVIRPLLKQIPFETTDYLWGVKTFTGFPIYMEMQEKGNAFVYHIRINNIAFDSFNEEAFTPWEIDPELIKDYTR